MTRRERLERKAELRREWAAKRAAKSAARHNAARAIGEHIPFGQPILVGHHSEKRHRRDLERIDNNMRAAVESSDMANHHLSKAAGIEDQLAGSIFSDDDNAIEALQARIDERKARRDRMKAINAAFRKAPGADKAAKLAAMVKAGSMTESEAIAAAKLFSICPYEHQPFPAYSLSNLGATIRNDEKRIADIRARAARTERAEEAGGVVIEGGEWVRVTFAEKPDRSILQALKEAGFYWGAGCWKGSRAKLPPAVVEMAGLDSVADDADADGITLPACKPADLFLSVDE